MDMKNLNVISLKLKSFSFDVYWLMKEQEVLSLFELLFCAIQILRAEISSLLDKETQFF